MNKTKIFLQPIAAVRKQISITVIVAFLKGVISFGFVFLLQKLAYAIQTGSTYDFGVRGAVLVATLIASLSINIFNNYYVNIMGYYLGNHLDEIHLKRFLQLDNNVVERLGTGKMSSIFQKGLMNWTALLWSMCTTRVRIGTTVILSIAYLAYQGWKFLLIGLGLILIAAVWIYIFHGKGRIYRKRQKELVGEVSRILVRWIMTKFEILQLGRYEQEVEREQKVNYEWSKMRMKESLRNTLCYDGVGFLIQLIVMAMLLYVGYSVIHGSYQFSDYVLFAGLLTLFGGIVTQLPEISKGYFDNRIHVSYIIDTLYDETTHSKTTFSGESFLHKKGEITFDNVSYDYGSGNVINNLSLTIQGGKKTALVGPSGGGKSTLTKLISGYLQPTEGILRVDGQDLSTVNITSYYRHLGYLTQDTLIFDGTIKENLTYAYKGTPTDKQMHDALTRAKCEFVFDFTDGLDTEIGERGIRLSGGQRQRLAIAKLFLKDPEIIILDEPTSALDSINEQAVTEAFNNLFSGRTVIIIAHRLQTVKEADETLMIENGKIVERGTHEELSKAGGTYQRMLELQSGFVG